MVYMRDPPEYDPAAEERYKRALQAREQQLKQRIKAFPNRIYFREIIWGILVIIFFTIPTIGFATLVAANMWFWVSAKPPWIKIALLMLSALILSFVAWLCREISKSKIYAVAEIIFGISLSTQGVVFSEGSENYLPAIIAYIGGVRIAIDGFKRFFEYKAYRLFSFTRVRYNWRKFKRWSRALDT